MSKTRANITKELSLLKQFQAFQKFQQFKKNQQQQMLGKKPLYKHAHLPRDKDEKSFVSKSGVSKSGSIPLDKHFFSNSVKSILHPTTDLMAKQLERLTEQVSDLGTKLDKLNLTEQHRSELAAILDLLEMQHFDEKINNMVEQKLTEYIQKTLDQKALDHKALDNKTASELLSSLQRVKDLQKESNEKDDATFHSKKSENRRAIILFYLTIISVLAGFLVPAYQQKKLNEQRDEEANEKKQSIRLEYKMLIIRKGILEDAVRATENRKNALHFYQFSDKEHLQTEIERKNSEIATINKRLEILMKHTSKKLGHDVTGLLGILQPAEDEQSSHTLLRR